MVLSVHVHLSTARRHPPTVALPASSSGTREPRSGNFDAPPSLPRPPTKTLSHATHKMEGLGDTVLPVPTYRYLGGLNAATTYTVLPIGGTDAGLPGDGPLGAKLGSLPSSRYRRFHCCFQSRCGWGTHTVQPGLRNEVPLWIFWEWESGTLTISGGLYWGESPVRSRSSLQTPRHITLVGRLDEIMFDAAVSNKAELATGNRGIISRRGCCLVGGLLLPCANPRTCHRPASNPDVASCTQASLLPRSRGAASNRHARPRFPRWQGE